MSVPEKALFALIADYLTNNCCSETLEAFQRETCFSNYSSNSCIDRQSMLMRSEIMKLVRLGNIQEAIKKTCLWQPRFPITCANLYFRLHCQHFVELLRTGAVHDALQFAQEQLVLLAKENPQMLQYLQEIAGVLAYEDPLQSPYANLFDSQMLDSLVIRLNNALLQLSTDSRADLSELDWTLSSMQPVTCKLDLLLRQLFVVENYRSDPKRPTIPAQLFSLYKMDDKMRVVE